MEKMQFRGFLFPHNPASISLERDEKVARYFCPGKGEFSRNLGRLLRVVRCEGCFYGRTPEEAAGQMERFLEAAGETEGEKQSGALFLPGMRPFQAHLREFSVTAKEDGCILPYHMVFVEGGGEA